MNLDSTDEEWKSLLEELRLAAKECEDAIENLALVSQKHSKLCVKVIVASRQIPIGKDMIEERERNTRLSVVNSEPLLSTTVVTIGG